MLDICDNEGQEFSEVFCGSKDYSKMHPVLCTDTDHDVTDLVNYEMFKNTKN